MVFKIFVIIGILILIVNFIVMWCCCRVAGDVDKILDNLDEEKEDNHDRI